MTTIKMDQTAMNETSSEQPQDAPSTTMKVDVSAVLGDKTKTGGETLSSCIDIENLNLFYSKDKQALIDINLTIPKQRVTAFIGPSGCGKSSLLRCFNRMNDLVNDCVIEGVVSLDGSDIYQKSIDVADLRRRVGMVFQKVHL